MNEGAGRTIEAVEGTAVALRGDDIDTDRIIPARFLRAVSFDRLEEHLFEDDRAAAASRGDRHVLDDPQRRGAAVLVVNRNFGCGSSREHAPQAIARRGIRAIVGESFAEIFFTNATTIGIPCLSAERGAVAAIMAAVEADAALRVRADLAALSVECGEERFDVRLPAPVRSAFLDGTWDATALLLDRFGEVRRAAARLPYFDGFPGAAPE
jgi:3-isopropylmalate/(R)-2-methylmalate dehydratase small subunit